jgi:hypothetical protein
LEITYTRSLCCRRVISNIIGYVRIEAANVKKADGYTASELEEV